MKIKVEYTQLSTLGNSLLDETKNIDLVMNNIKQLIEKIPNNWMGLDSIMFVAKGGTLVKQVGMIKEQIEASGTFIKEAVSDYQEIESKYESLVGEV